MGKRHWRQRIALGGIGLLSVCLLMTVVSALSNIGLPRRSAVVERLSQADKAQLVESLHLRETMGEAVWTGWGEADIPVTLYNESYAFLVGVPNPTTGWTTVPRGMQRGGPWEPVPGDLFGGQPYYRQALTDPDVTPQAFVVQVGERWVASMTTLEWTHIKLQTDMQAGLPAFLRPLLPYRVLLGGFGSDWHIAAIGHESFHAFQGMLAPDRVAAAEYANQAAAAYPWDEDTFRAAWATELDLLRQSLGAETDQEAAVVAQAWLAAREARRQEAGLSTPLVDFERQREWLEGLAKYAEMELWRRGATAGYEPVAAMTAVPGFHAYADFEQRWDSELVTLGNQAGSGETRFYYSGWAQAVLLDRLAPNWKARAMEPNVWLEQLVEEAVAGE